MVISLLILVFRVGQKTLRALQEIVSQEETAQRVLNTAAHLDEIAKDLAPWQFIRSDVNVTDGDQQVPEQPENDR